ncbi:hypothetical protein H6G00_01975 [Leptolyngbya sp. FACHB-541]|uniref:hypothetical protein n=1 Tax=Leptolyngbya sp. FACHB-541 TaxID=2692810 RepID=UPI0016856D61|nr:hypothetical protein [Leptolyngbya sp. FACHB-541]MBD1995400.1 hypothetical protein [Leptolyngbya sp. FACHB-541]
MQKTITIQLRGKTYSAEATDLDAMFFLSLMLPNFVQIKQTGEGLIAALDEFSSKQRGRLAHVKGEKAIEAASKELYSEWGERVLIQLNNNLDVRAAFAQRVTEVFDDIDPKLVRFERWRENERLHESSKIRLDVDEIMAVISPFSAIMADLKKEQLQGESIAAQPQLVSAILGDDASKTSGKGFAPTPAAASQPNGKDAQIAALQAQLAQLQQGEPENAEVS